MEEALTAFGISLKLYNKKLLVSMIQIWLSWRKSLFKAPPQRPFSIEKKGFIIVEKEKEF